MISVIICSVDSDDLHRVSENVLNTIGIPFEIISVNNRIEKKGICQVYNECAAKAKFDTLCFMHEDIDIRTFDWGKIIIDTFNSDKRIGIIGVAGGGYKAMAPSGWYCVEFYSPYKSFQNILQGYKLDDKNEIHAYHNPLQEKLSEVVCVDGVWFCSKKEIVLKNPFDQKLLTGFHGYDLDFCLNVFGRYRIVVTYDVLLKHASEGNFNKFWLDEILKIHKKWNKILPLTTSDATEKDIYFTEKRAIKNVVEQMLDWNYSIMDIHHMLIAGLASRRLPVRLFFKAYIHFIKQRWK